MSSREIYGHRDQCRSHALMRLVRVGGCVDVAVRAGDGVVKEFAEAGAGVALAGEKFNRGLDSHSAGDFAGGVSAHAVTNNEDSVVRIETEAVFVVGANAADVRVPGNVQTHALFWLNQVSYPN